MPRYILILLYSYADYETQIAQYAHLSAPELAELGGSNSKDAILKLQVRNTKHFSYCSNFQNAV